MVFLRDLRGGITDSVIWPAFKINNEDTKSMKELKKGFFFVSFVIFVVELQIRRFG